MTRFSFIRGRKILTPSSVKPIFRTATKGKEGNHISSRVKTSQKSSDNFTFLTKYDLFPTKVHSTVEN